MTNTVIIEKREAYGTTRFYPTNMEATAFARIANTTTLTPAVLHEIGLLGFKIVTADRTGWLASYEPTGE